LNNFNFLPCHTFVLHHQSLYIDFQICSIILEFVKFGFCNIFILFMIDTQNRKPSLEFFNLFLLRIYSKKLIRKYLLYKLLKKHNQGRKLSMMKPWSTEKKKWMKLLMMRKSWKCKEGSVQGGWWWSRWWKPWRRLGQPSRERASNF